MSDTTAAATLTLEISTEKARAELQALETKYGELLTKLSTARDAGAGLTVSKEAAAQIEKLTADTLKLQQAMGESTRTVRTLEAELAKLQKTGSAATASSGSTIAAKASLDAMGTSYQRMGSTIQQATQHQLHWNKVANEAHAAARGLSGSLGTLWVTYGSIAPLLAGAAVGGALKGVFETGKALEYEFSIVSAISKGATVDLMKFNEAVRGTMFTPMEAAKGYRVLAQAGLDTVEAMQALPAVLKLATVGETDMANAALSATAIMHTFGMTVSDIGHIGDVFSKAAAISATSVKEMMEAMKQASSVSNMFGVSLEETAAALATLANRGIEGSAAGTAIRNMVKELASPATEKAANAMRQFGIEIFNADGSAKTFTQNLQQLSDVTSQMSSKTKARFLEELFNERGAKAANILLTDLEKMKTAMEDLEKASKGLGFMTDAQITISQSTTGMLKGVATDIQLMFADVFESVEPQIKEIVSLLADFARSDGLKEAMTSLATSVANATKFLIEHADAVKNVVLAYVGWKAASVAGSALIGLSAVTAGANLSLVSLAGGLAAASGAMGPVAAGTSVLGTAMAGLGALLSGPVAIGLGALAAGYLLWTNRSIAVTEAEKRQLTEVEGLANAMERLNASITRGTEALSKENDVLELQIKKMKEGKSAADALREAKGDLAKAGYVEDLAKAKSLVDSAQAKYDATGADARIKATAAPLTDAEEQLALQLIAAKKAYARIEAEHKTHIDNLANAEAQGERNKAAKEQTSLQATIEVWNKRREIAIKMGEESAQALKTTQFSNTDVSKNAKKLLENNVLRGEAAKAQTEILATGDYASQVVQAKAAASNKVLDAFQNAMAPKAGKDPKGGTSGNSDAYQTQMSAFKQHIDEYEQTYKTFIAATGEMQAQGNLSSLAKIQSDGDAKLAILDKQIELEQAAIKAANTKDKPDLEKNLNKLQEERLRAEMGTNTALLNERSSFGDSINKLDLELSGRTESALVQAGNKLQGAWADKMAQALLNASNGNAEIAKQAEEDIERLTNIGKNALRVADFTDIVNGVKLAVSDTMSEVAELEANMARDGGWVERLLGSEKIMAVIEETKIAIAPKMEELRQAMLIGDKAAEKQYYVVKASYDKMANYVTGTWKDITKSIDGTVHQAFSKIFSKGKTDWKAFGREIGDDLKTTLLDALYQVFVRKWVLSVVADVSQGAGWTGLASAALDIANGRSVGSGGAGTSGIGGMANNVSTLSSVYGYGQAAYAGYGMTAAQAQMASAAYSQAGQYGSSWAMQAGNYVGGLFGGGTAAGAGYGVYGASSLGATAPIVSGEVAAAAAGQGAAGAGGWSSMLGSAAAGAWVLAIPAIAGAISAAGSRKAYEFDGIAIKGDYAGSNFTGSAATKWEADGGWWESGDKMKKWMPLTDNKDTIIEAFFGGGLSRNGMTGYVTPVSGEYSKAIDMANLGDLRDTPAIAGVDNSKAAAEWDAQYAAWQKANPRVWSGIGWAGSGEDWTGGERPEEVSGYMPSFMGAGFFGSVTKTPVLSTDPVMLKALDNAIDAIFKATQTSFKALADQFDDTDLAGKVDAFSTSINLDTKSGDIDKVLATLASDVNAKMAQAFLPSIETLRLPEEAWQTAFNRVMVEVAGTSRILDMMGVSIKETFGSDTNKAITAIDGLSKAFGGIDNLSTSFGAYYANFYSQEEQRAQAMEDMGKAFTSLNLAMPETRAGFKALVEAQDLTTTSGQATFKSLMDLQGGFANLVPAITDVSTAVTDAAEALAKDRAALIAARNEATEAASTSLSDMQAAFDDLQKSITQGTVNGNLGALAFSASEFDSISSFVGYIDEANVKLAEIAKSPFADELSNYTTQIKALAQSVQDQAADTLINSRMLVGDIAGAIAAEVSKTQIDQSTYMLSEQGGKPRRGDFATRSDFDAAFAKWASPQFVASAYNMASEERSIKAALTIANQISANALRIPNAGSVGSAPVGVSGEYRYKLMREIASEYGIGSQSVLEQTLASALESGVGKLLRSNYTATGPGIARVNAAVNNYNDASKTGYVDGKFLMGADAISFAEGMRSLDATLKAGKLSVVDYAKGVDFLTGTFGGAMGDINDARLAAGSMAGAMAAAGSASIVYYFDQIAQQVASLAKASEQAAEPISQAVLAIGRMNSASTVFGQSASAVMNGYLGMMGSAQGIMADSGSSDAQQRDALAMYANGAYGQNAAMQEGSDYRNAVLVSTAASVVSQIMTTQSAAEAAKLLAEKASFAGASNTQLRDASLLMDGLAQFDAVSLENVFNRLANALSTSKITEGQYVDMVSQSIDTFRGLDEETEAVKTAMQRLAESMGGFADKLLIDQSRTTIGATQTLAEIERQYSVARDSAKTGDANSISNYQSLANALLDKAMYDTQADYNDAFGKVYGDAKSLESVGVNTVAKINGDNVVTELKKMNTELSDRVESLERNLTTALAVIAKNTAKTSSGIEQINTVGLPA